MNNHDDCASSNGGTQALIPVIHSNPRFGQVRSVEMPDGTRALFATDYAKALGYQNPAKAVRDHCKGVNETLTPTSGGPQMVKIIGEADCYRLAMRSNLPEAVEVQDWVCEEVLVSIRKTGGYGQTLPALPENCPNFDDPAEAAEAWARQVRLVRLAKKESLMLESKLGETTEERDAARDRAATATRLFAAAVPDMKTVKRIMNSEGLTDMNAMAKELGTGRTRFMKWLRATSILISGEAIPYQRHIQAGYMVVKKTLWQDSQGLDHPVDASFFTPKGVVWITRRWIEAEEKADA